MPKKRRRPQPPGELDPHRQRHSKKPLPGQQELFDRSEFVPTKNTRQRSER